MRKGSENKKKERKKNETIETAVIRFGNGSNDRGDVDDGICTGKCIGGQEVMAVLRLRMHQKGLYILSIKYLMQK